MHDSLKRSSAFNSSSSLNKGVLYELYLLFDIDLIACFCSLLMLIYHSVGVTNNEEYIIFRMCIGM